VMVGIYFVNIQKPKRSNVNTYYTIRSLLMNVI